MRRRCPWRKPVVFMRRSAWIEEELLVYFTCTHTYTYIYIYSHEETSVGGEAAAAGEAGDGGNGYKDRRAPSFLELKKRKRKTRRKVKIQRTSLSVCTTTSRATSSDDIITFVHAHEYLHFPTRPLFYRSSGPRWKKEVPLNFSLKKIPTPFYKGQGFPISFFLLLRKK